MNNEHIHYTSLSQTYVLKLIDCKIHDILQDAGSA